MPILIDITDKKFGRLTARKIAFSRHYVFWHCDCDCGKQSVVSGKSLRDGNTKSCGCLRYEGSIRHGYARQGAARRPEFVAWQAMLKRCNNPKTRGYEYYGGRGITVCKRWLRFENFIADMGNRPGKGMSLDRINPDGHYKPSNCRWATATEQSRNRRAWGTAR
jgi:hypothetical protein